MGLRYLAVGHHGLSRFEGVSGSPRWLSPYLLGFRAERWQPRSGFGWDLFHIVGYFLLILMCCIAWPCPLVVGEILVAFAVLLEDLQAFMPDRSSYYLAAVYSAAGVAAGAAIPDLFFPARRRLQPNGPENMKA